MNKCSFFVLTFVLFVFLSTPALAADIPDLTGEWKGKAMGFVYTKGKLHHNQSENVLTYVIERQEGRFIFGRKIVTRSVDGGTHEEAMVGIISADGRTFHMADYEAGYAVGEIKSANELEISYLSDGTSPTDKDMVALVHQLKRSN